MIDRLQALAAFSARFPDASAPFGSWQGGGRSAEGYTIMPYFCLDEDAMAFVNMAYKAGWVLQDFDWGDWKGSPEAARLLHEPSVLAEACVDDLARLLSLCIREDRFCEGTLGEAFNSGLIAGIIRRAGVLLQELQTR